MERSYRIDWLCLLLLAILLGGFYFATLRPGQDWGGDFSQYINHARNIALGRPYLETHYVVTLPEAAVHMPASYPPVFPLLIAPVYARFGLNYVALKMVPEIMFVLAALALYGLARLRGGTPLEAFFAAGAFGLSGIVLEVKDAVLSDSTYLFFAGLTLVALLWIEQKRWDELYPARSAAVVAVLMLLAYGSRAIGLSLIMAFVLYEALVKRRFRRFNLFVLAIFAVGVLLILRIYDTRSYANQFVPEPMTYLHNALLYVRAPSALWGGSPGPVRHALFAITLLVAAAEWLRRVLTRPSIVEFYAASVVLPVILYSAGHSDRYLMPLFPIYLVYFVEGAADLRDHFFSNRQWVVLLAGLLLAVGAAGNVWGMKKGAYPAGVEQASFHQACDFLRENDKAGLVVSWNPRVLGLYTDLPSAWYPFVPQDTTFDEYLDRVHARYILIYLGNEDDRHWLLPHIQHQPRMFADVFHNPDFIVYAVNPSEKLSKQ
jgi:hypothetical protein